jgi:hypothetical protein
MKSQHIRLLGITKMKARMMSSLYGLNELGYRRVTMAVTKSSNGASRSKSQKSSHSLDCPLKLGVMRAESLVIVEQHATVNLSTDLVHTARHAEGIGLALIRRRGMGKF